MTEDEKYKTIYSMIDYGGHFVKQLARTWIAADTANRTIIETSFSHYFKEYHARFINVHGMDK